MLDSSDDSFLFGGKYGIGIAKKDSNQTRLLHRFWNEEERNDGKEGRMRANDGEVDSEGRFWVNTMCDPEVTSSAPDGTNRLVHHALLRPFLLPCAQSLQADFAQVFCLGWTKMASSIG